MYVVIYAEISSFVYSCFQEMGACGGIDRSSRKRGKKKLDLKGKERQSSKMFRGMHV